jgi:5'-methylthioadenosine phosphorylase
MEKGKIGIIGGTGLYEMDGLKIKSSKKIQTPFGDPSDEYIIGELEGKEVVFLPRHGKGHRILPSEINFRANIYGMKTLGVEWILSVSACGSMKEELKPLDIVIPDQFFDRTRNRVSTFFGNGIVSHVAFADPFCDCLRKILYQAKDIVDCKLHFGGIYLCMEGPQFSTRAESNIYRSWGVDIIGMTNLQEAKLAREAEICYATLACVTDYDCWHESEEEVSIEAVIANLKKNVKNAQIILRHAVKNIGKERNCQCANSLQFAIITQPDLIPQDIKKKLSPIIGKYIPS